MVFHVCLLVCIYASQHSSMVVQGNRDNIDSMAAGSQKVMMQVLKLIDAHNLYGSVAYPKHHTQADITDIYRFAHATRGVFVNIALQEPFGLTVIEVWSTQSSCFRVLDLLFYYKLVK